MTQVIHENIWLQCSPARAWELFTQPVGLVTWLADQAEIVPQIGGKYELYWLSGPAAPAATDGCRITSWEPERMLAFTWRVPPRFGPQPLTLATVFFAPENGGTKIHLLHSGWAGEVSWHYAAEMPDRASSSAMLRPVRQPNAAQIWQQRAWHEALQRLAQQVNHKTPACVYAAGRPGLSLAALFGPTGVQNSAFTR